MPESELVRALRQVFEGIEQSASYLPDGSFPSPEFMRALLARVAAAEAVADHYKLESEWLAYSFQEFDAYSTEQDELVLEYRRLKGAQG